MKIDSTNVLLIGGIGIVSLIIFFVLKKNSSNDQRTNRSNVIALKDSAIKYSFPLIFKEKISSNTYRFRFELPSSKHTLGFQIGQCIYLSARINGEFVKRPYTPITLDDDRGYFDLLIKIYPDGKMGQYLASLPLGHSMDVSGPAGDFLYRGNGLFRIRSTEKRISQLVLIAGGSGLTAVLQLLKKIHRKETEEENPRQVFLLYANRTEEDILLRDEIESIINSNPSRYHLWLTVDQTSNPRWKYSQGYFNETLFRNHLPPPSDQILICLCGPTQMIQSACLTHLHHLGYSSSMIHIF